MSNSINEFLGAFANDQRYFLNLPELWSVTIDGVSEGSINTVLNYAGEKWQARTSPESMTRGGGILVAQAVNLPSEGSTFDPYPSGGTMGGFLPGFGLGNRQNFLNDRQISVNFLETQLDIEHNFFRPWMIALGIKGLIEEGVSLKGNMQVRQYSNGGQFIKGFKFKKVFPTGIESYTLNYESNPFPVKSVTFACENYEQL